MVWTVNKREDMARMIELGVDGIISDRPDLLRQVAGGGNCIAGGNAGRAVALDLVSRTRRGMT